MAERARGGWVRYRILKLALFVVLVMSVAGWETSGTQPEVRQPDSYNALQRGVLSMATAELEKLLGDSSLGSRMRLDEREWTSQEFSAFTAGALTQLGYETVVVSGQGSSKPHVWVLVGVDVGDGTAWIPVEATPTSGVAQNSLGHVAWGGGDQYAETYLQYDRVLDLGFNLAPNAVVRAPAAAPFLGEFARFLAVQSRDPDGEIILYVWKVDEGKRPAMTKAGFYDHVFEREGSHTLTLTVVDSRGMRASTAVSFNVYVYDDEPGESDCGCGGG